MPGKLGFRVPPSSPPFQYDEGQDETLKSSVFSSRGLKRSRNGEAKPQTDFGNIARGLCGNVGTADLDEPDELILTQESILARMQTDAETTGDKMAAAGDAVSQLTAMWHHHADTVTIEGGVGPDTDDGLSEAYYLASLLFQLHHPHVFQPNSLALSRIVAETCVDSVPRVLLDWLSVHHNPFPDDYEDVYHTSPSPASHEGFWECVNHNIMRGKFSRVVKLLSSAGWEHAATAQDDRADDDHYSDRQLESIRAAVEPCIRLLQSCPGMRFADWDVTGPDWLIFRQQVEQELRQLQAMAGTDKPLHPTPLGMASCVAESKVPWAVFQSLQSCYGLLLGNVDDILDVAQDWLEGALYLTIWWDGLFDGEIPDMELTDAYRQRLVNVFAIVTDVDDPAYIPDAATPVHVGLACILTDNVDGTISVLQSMSMPIAAATVEVATLGGWLQSKRTQALFHNFDDEDLMVLSHGPGQGERPMANHDQILSEYAESLSQRPTLQLGDTIRDGWEPAMAILNRLDDVFLLRKKVSELLDGLETTDESKINRVLAACAEQNLTSQLRSISERYAEYLINHGQDYGSALCFFARAHAPAKIKQELAILTSFCLVQSAAIPIKADLDPVLASLLSDRSALVELSSQDPEAADMLSSSLSGYATLRRFYNLRDSSMNPSLSTNREAATALMAVLESAADCIHGGLYDPDVEVIIPVDAVVVLLGESLPLLGQTKRIFTKDQIFTLLRIVEDIDTAPRRIRQGAETLLAASVDYHRSMQDGVVRPQDVKSNPDRRLSGGGKSSAVVKRGWDWRTGLAGLKTKELGNKEVLMLVRVALAQEVARGWTGAIHW
ncbi:hypothetical protein K470DRAFT_213664 [Piedraia hortae CBS 480.64]|uniref:Nuclear pore complex protein Nup85 n=1 Tax=Piedraia hortae CBS 480.64 TaxID=1314780 RepID=A0A6A7C4P5_9PEZI|nr:hypothetical protein K470DRAFT_213664 [Piedraia hortae CBS 480.64]